MKMVLSAIASNRPIGWGRRKVETEITFLKKQQMGKIVEHKAIFLTLYLWPLCPRAAGGMPELQ